MSIQYIRKQYDVPAALGGRVRYTGGDEPQHESCALGAVDRAEASAS